MVRPQSVVIVCITEFWPSPETRRKVDQIEHNGDTVCRLCRIHLSDVSILDSRWAGTCDEPSRMRVESAYTERRRG